MQQSSQSIQSAFPLLSSSDPQLAALLVDEEHRQRDKIRLIASENYVSGAVREACASVITNQYSEGYPGARYYEGQQIVDQVERLAIDRAKALFGAEHVNVQPHSGSPANLAVYLAFLKPGDTVLAMQLAHGGHLTHGSKASITGKHWNVVHYGLDPQTRRLDTTAIRELALQHRPKLLIAGHSAYPRLLDFAAFRAIADEVGALLMVDMAHFAGLVAGGAHPSPVPYADVVTTTTHKSLRGPRGAMILCRAEHAAKIDKAVFPGLQGGPHNAITAAIAATLNEALRPEFATYAAQCVTNARALADELMSNGFELVTGGTDNHLILIDLRNKGIGGKPLAAALDRAGLVTNYNAAPWDDQPPQNPSGLRLGSPSMTTRGFGETEFRQIARWLARVVDSGLDESVITTVAAETGALCRRFPLP
ncbi:serine hydroxymethyltransferase [Propionivibrio dicarboxylicus]|uniref:Serine hydroxymethyltransferase n=1 Tax=Propionivibrio dicarboxylicus TaxID=83767 RepID=A0A1G7Y4C8_9RHOO|nr:serine hydroxymethyltransferase [Propionivibrio dicarboxylicus]SDG91239.1 serine hydroxymethyltransferase [Propionivibrio dicarboxylicus]